jgi:hypothetical protein
MTGQNPAYSAFAANATLKLLKSRELLEVAVKYAREHRCGLLGISLAVSHRGLLAEQWEHSHNRRGRR